jgi:Helicase associated domain
MYAASARSARVKNDLDAWYQYLRELWQYKQEYGDCRVQRTNDHKALADWVRRQRMRKDLVAFPLSQDQVDALNQIGFEWNERPGAAHTQVRATGAANPSSYPSSLTNQHTPSVDAFHVGSSSNLQDSTQSNNATSLGALVRLEPLPREIEAAEAR